MCASAHQHLAAMQLYGRQLTSSFQAVEVASSRNLTVRCRWATSQLCCPINAPAFQFSAMLHTAQTVRSGVQFANKASHSSSSATDPELMALKQAHDRGAELAAAEAVLQIRTESWLARSNLCNAHCCMLQFKCSRAACNAGSASVCM